MSLSNSAENNLMLLIFNNTNWANIGDATGLRGSSTAGSFYVSAHTSDPGEGGDQTTNETSYSGYSRSGTAAARSGSGWTVSNNQASNAAAISLGQCASGSATLTHAGIGRASSAAGELLFSGALTSSLAVSANITPSFAIGALIAQFE